MKIEIKGNGLMWSTFFTAMAVACVFLYAPGFFVMRALRAHAVVALCIAPCASIVLYAATTTVWPIIGIEASWVTVALPCIVLPAVVALWRLRVRGDRRLFGIAPMGRSLRGKIPEAWVLVALYVACGLVVVGIVFIKNLDGPDSFLQAWDNSHHLSSVRAFVESGDYSMLTTTSYATAIDRACTPFPNDSMFYPSAWHTLCALTVSATGASVPLAVNAVNALIIGVVIPTSMLFLMARLFPGQRGVVRCGALVSLAFAVFPWGFLTFGPLYPNMLSYAVMAPVGVLFMAIFDADATRRRIACAGLFCMGIVALACAQPNAVFTLAVFLAPFCIVTATRSVGALSLARRYPRAVRWGAGLLCAALIASIWWALFHAPFLQDVIWYDWPAKETHAQAIANIALLSFSYAPAQLLLAVFVGIGLACVLADARFRWFGWSFVLAAFICYIDLSHDGFIKHVLAGFWYTDQLRTASTAALFAIPLAALGLHHTASVAAHLLNSFVRASGGKPISYGTAAAALAAAVVVFFPSYDIPGHHHVETGFGAIRERVEDQNSVVMMNYLDAAEKDFVKQVREIVPDDEVIINSPDDGSIFLYGYDGLRTYYRYLTGYSIESGESADSAFIRKGLYRLAADARVKEAVRAIGAQYVLVLDQGKDDAAESDDERWRFILKDETDDEVWSGIRAIDDETPGFEIVLSQDDMRLYRMVL